MFHDKSKHIEIKYHYIQDMVQRAAVRLHHISTDEQIVDMCTKALSKGKFLVFREQLGLMDVTLLGKGPIRSRRLSNALPPLFEVTGRGIKLERSWG